MNQMIAKAGVRMSSWPTAWSRLCGPGSVLAFPSGYLFVLKM